MLILQLIVLGWSIQGTQHTFSLSGIMLTRIQKHADAAPFKKKGVFHYNHMAILMPNHVHGTHAFYPSQQSFSTITNQSFTSDCNMAMPRDTSNDLSSGDSSDGERAAPLIPQLTPQHPPISTSSASIDSFASCQSKHKYSTFDDGDSMSVKSGSLTSLHDKCQCNTGASVLYSLGAKMDKMNDMFANGFAQESKAHIHPDSSPLCRAKAAKASKGLTNEQKVTIIDLFETNSVVADMFLAVDEDDDDL